MNTQMLQMDGAPPIPEGFAIAIDRTHDIVAGRLNSFDGREVDRVRNLLQQRKKVVVEARIGSNNGRTGKARIPLLSVDGPEGGFVAFTCEYDGFVQGGVAYGPNGIFRIVVSQPSAI